MSIPHAIYARSKITTSGGGTVVGDIAINSSNTGAIEINGNPSLQSCTIHIQKGAVPSVVINKPDWYNLPAVVADISPTYSYELPSPPNIPSLSDYPMNLPAAKEDIYLSGNNNKEISGNAIYNNIHIEANNTLTINVGSNDEILRVKNLDIPQGNIVIKGSGSLTLYIDNIKALKGYINKDGSPAKLKVYTPVLNSLSGETTIGGSLYISSDWFLLTGGAKICGDLYFGGSEIDLSGGAKINGSIYAGDTNVRFRGGATIENNIITSGALVDMSGGTDVVNGVVYAPDAKVDMSGGAQITGALIADTVNMSGGPAISYDANAISNNPVIVGGSQVAFEMGYWQ